MAYNRVIWRGTLPGGEVWSSGCSFMMNFGDLVQDAADLNAWALAIRQIGGTSVFPAAIRDLLSAAGACTSVRTEYLADDGSLLQAGEYTFAGAAGLGSATKAFQTSVVASLRTATPGRRTRGRMYWPALGAAIDTSTGRLSDPTTSEVAAAVVELLQDVADEATNVNPSAAVVPAVWSRENESGSVITSVEVGDVLDTQRRRRDKLAEVRAVEAATW